MMLQVIASRQPTYAEVILDDSPVLYIRFDDTAGTAARTFGQEVYTATYTDSPTLAREGPLLGDGLAVGLNISSPVNERVVVANDASIDLTVAWTIEAWMNVIAASGFSDLCSKNTNDNLRIIIQLVSAATNEVGIGTGSGAVDMGSWDSSFSHLGDWRLLHAAFDVDIPGDDEGEAFLDTIEGTNSPASLGSPISNVAALIIGNRAALDRDFRGDVAEYALYDRRLSPGEREKHFIARDMKVSPGDYWN